MFRFIATLIDEILVYVGAFVGLVIGIVLLAVLIHYLPAWALWSLLAFFVLAFIGWFIEWLHLETRINKITEKLLKTEPRNKCLKPLHTRIAQSINKAAK